MKRIVTPAVLAGFLAAALGCGGDNKAVAPGAGASGDIGKPKVITGGNTGMKEGFKGSKNSGEAAD